MKIKFSKDEISMELKIARQSIANIDSAPKTISDQLFVESIPLPIIFNHNCNSEKLNTVVCFDGTRIFEKLHVQRKNINLGRNQHIYREIGKDIIPLYYHLVTAATKLGRIMFIKECFAFITTPGYYIIKT